MLYFLHKRLNKYNIYIYKVGTFASHPRTLVILLWKMACEVSQFLKSLASHPRTQPLGATGTWLPHGACLLP